MACLERSKVVSQKLTGTQIDRALEAASYAREIERDFTHQLSIHWEHADGDGRVQDRQQRFLICVRRWLERRGEELVSLWVVEPDKIGKGCHVHTLLYLPRRLVPAFVEMLPAWTNTQPLDAREVRKAKTKYRQKYSKGAVAWCGYPEQMESPVCLLQRRYDGSERLVRYLLKAEAAQPRHHGKVVGKRIGYSNFIGPAQWQSARTSQLQESVQAQ
jgi:hypothetical protein